MQFRIHKSGMNYLFPRDQELIFFNTVSENKEGFTPRQIKGAEVARALYSPLIYPSDKDYKWVIFINQTKNCPVTVQDVEFAQKVWGNNIAALKGKITRRNPNVVYRYQVKISAGLIKLHKEVFLICDIFFVKKIPFFMTLSRKIYFTEVNYLENCTVPLISKAFKEIYQYYLHRGFCITTVNADRKFGPLKILIESLIGGPLVNLATANKHIPDIKRKIRVVKERCTATLQGIYFQRILKLLNTHVFLNTAKTLNLFPTKGLISESLSPKTIMSGKTLDFKNHLRLQLGQ